MGQALPLAPRTAIAILCSVAAATAGGCHAESSDRTVPTADVERLKTVVPSQSHSMSDVGFHWTNLWFAGQQGNWPLAQFYFDEARQHIQWTIQIRPIRKGSRRPRRGPAGDLSGGRREHICGCENSYRAEEQRAIRDRLQGRPGRLLLLPQVVRQAIPPSDRADRSRADHHRFQPGSADRAVIVPML